LAWTRIRLDPLSSAASSTTPAPSSSRDHHPRRQRDGRRALRLGRRRRALRRPGRALPRPEGAGHRLLIGVSRLQAGACRASTRTSQPPRRPRRCARSWRRTVSPSYQKMAQSLRAAGIRAEMYLGTAGMKAQMKYADKRGAPASSSRAATSAPRRGADQGPDRRRQGRRHHQGLQGVARRPPGAGVRARSQPRHRRPRPSPGKRVEPMFHADGIVSCPLVGGGTGGGDRRTLLLGFPPPPSPSPRVVSKTRLRHDWGGDLARCVVD
jgi:hypothetical protein